MSVAKKMENQASDEKKSRGKTVITFGTYDLFHYGHLRILQRAASEGDRLIVGVSSDALNWRKKQNNPAINETQRMAIVGALKCVDGVFLEESLALKKQYCMQWDADVLVMGDDHLNEYNEMLEGVCDCVYLARTAGVSSTKLKSDICLKSADTLSLHVTDFDISPASTASCFSSLGLTRFQLSLAAVLICAYTVTILTIASLKGEGGKLPYNTSTVVVCVELIKLLLSLYLLRDGSSLHGVTKVLTDKVSIISMLQYAVPSFIYCVNNNLYLWILAGMPPAVFQMLQNSRIVMTGLAFRFILGRFLSQRQWIATFIMLIACSLMNPQGDMGAEIAMTSYWFAAIYIGLSVFVSVYSESLLKKESNIHVSNVQLYACGVFFGIIALWGQQQAPFTGFGFHTCLIVALQVIQGLTVSYVIKHLDSVYKLYCSAFSNFAVYIVSLATGTQDLTIQFCIAFVLICSSAVMYARNKLPKNPVVPNATSEATSESNSTETRTKLV